MEFVFTSQLVVCINRTQGWSREMNNVNVVKQKGKTLAHSHNQPKFVVCITHALYTPKISRCNFVRYSDLEFYS